MASLMITSLQWAVNKSREVLVIKEKDLMIRIEQVETDKFMFPKKWLHQGGHTNDTIQQISCEGIKGWQIP